MPSVTDIPLAPGEIVRARSRRYLVEEVTPPPNAGDETFVRLSCLEDDAEGEELEVLWEKEVDARRIDAADWSKLAGGQFDDARQFAAYYHTLRWNAVTGRGVAALCVDRCVARVFMPPFRERDDPEGNVELYFDGNERFCHMVNRVFLRERRRKSGWMRYVRLISSSAFRCFELFSCPDGLLAS